MSGLPALRFAAAAGVVAALVLVSARAPAQEPKDDQNDPANDGEADGENAIGPRPVLATAVAPDHWRKLPELASPADKALQSLSKDMEPHARAWGDPASGAYALLVEGRARQTARPRKRRTLVNDVHTQFRELLQSRGATLDSWTTRTDETTVRSDSSIQQHEHRGAVRVWSGYDQDGHLHAVVALCFHNDREPQRTGRECRRWLESVSLVQPLAPIELPDD